MIALTANENGGTRADELTKKVVGEIVGLYNRTVKNYPLVVVRKGACTAIVADLEDKWNKDDICKATLKKVANGKPEWGQAIVKERLRNDPIYLMRARSRVNETPSGSGALMSATARDMKAQLEMEDSESDSDEYRPDAGYEGDYREHKTRASQKGRNIRGRIDSHEREEGLAPASKRKNVEPGMSVSNQDLLDAITQGTKRYDELTVEVKAIRTNMAGMIDDKLGEFKEDVTREIRVETGMYAKRIKLLEEHREQDRENVVGEILTNEGFRDIVRDEVKGVCGAMQLDEAAMEGVQDQFKEKFGGEITDLKESVSALREELEAVKIGNIEAKNAASAAEQKADEALVAVANIGNIEPAQYTTEAVRHKEEGRMYGAKVREGRRIGIIRLHVAAEELYLIQDTVDPDTNLEVLKITLNSNLITRTLGCAFDVLGAPWATKKRKVHVNIKLTGKPPKTMREFAEKLIANRKEKKGLGMSFVTPAGYNRDKVWELWIKAGTLIKYDVTKAGFYVLFVKDGKKILEAGDWDYSSTEYSAYLDTCSRINVDNPVGLAKLRTPSIPNLRKIARKSHFVASNGECIAFPPEIKNTRGRAKISDDPNRDDPDEGANNRLEAFLKSQGLGENNTIVIN